MCGILAFGVLERRDMPIVSADGLRCITDAKIFDGDCVIGDKTVVIRGAIIQAVGGSVPSGATVVDGRGATLMPGSIDSHVDTDSHGLHDALLFGVTTELEMNGHWTAKKRKEIAGLNRYC